MSENVTDVNFTAIKMYGSDKPVFIPANIEDNQLAHFIRRREREPQFIETRKLAFVHDFEPAQKWALAVWVLLPKGSQRFLRDDMHGS